EPPHTVRSTVAPCIRRASGCRRRARGRRRTIQLRLQEPTPGAQGQLVEEKTPGHSEPQVREWLDLGISEPVQPGHRLADGLGNGVADEVLVRAEERAHVVPDV